MTRTLLSVVAIVGWPLAATAHGVSGQCLAHGDQVTVHAYFDDDQPAVAASVCVRDSSGRELVSGTTDDQGAWTFANPGAGSYVVVIDAGGGHRTELRLELADGRFVNPTQVNRGPTRSTFTGNKLGKIAFGLLVIAALAIGLRQFLRRRVQPPASPVQ